MMQPNSKTKDKIKRFERLKTEKRVFYTIYDLVSEFVMNLNTQFQGSKVYPMDIFNRNVLDDTAVNANQLMASTFVGSLWPNGARAFQIAPPANLQSEYESEEEAKKYYDFVTKTMVSYMDNPKAGLMTSLEEYMLEQGAYGLSGIGVFEKDDLEIPVCYKPFVCKELFIDEDQYGLVDTIYISKCITIRQMVMEYGIEKLSEQQKKLYEDGDVEEKVEVLIALYPRHDRDPYKSGNLDMAYVSCHIDVENQTELRESGFQEMPIFISRFWKRSGHKYGFSPAMNALPSIMELNAFRESIIMAAEKQLAPPLAVWDGGILGSRGVETSAHALNVFSVSGRLGNYSGKLIEPLYTVGDLQPAYARITELMEIIKNHFFQDRLLDLNNEVRMTLGEANIRNELRQQTLGTIYARQLQEIYNPLIERTFNILLRKGLLGVARNSEQEMMLIQQGIEPIYIPDSIVRRMVKGEDVYKIIYVSPATRAMQLEELTGIERTAVFVQQNAQVNPEILDTIDMDVMIKRVSELTGCPREMVRSLDAITAIREARQQQQQQAMQIEAAGQVSSATKDMATASKMDRGG